MRIQGMKDSDAILSDGATSLSSSSILKVGGSNKIIDLGANYAEKAYPHIAVINVTTMRGDSSQTYQIEFNNGTANDGSGVLLATTQVITADMVAASPYGLYKQYLLTLVPKHRYLSAKFTGGGSGTLAFVASGYIYVPQVR